MLSNCLNQCKRIINCTFLRKPEWGLHTNPHSYTPENHCENVTALGPVSDSHPFIIITVVLSFLCFLIFQIEIVDINIDGSHHNHSCVLDYCIMYYMIGYIKIGMITTRKLSFSLDIFTLTEQWFHITFCERMRRTWKRHGPLLLDELNLTPAWISNHMLSIVWYETTNPFPNLNCGTVEVLQRISNFTPHFPYRD